MVAYNFILHGGYSASYIPSSSKTASLHKISQLNPMFCECKEVTHPQYAKKAPRHHSSRVPAGVPVARRIVDGVENMPVPIMRFAIRAVSHVRS